MAQEVYLRMLRLERPELIRSPEAYLFTIAANIVREQALKNASRPLHLALHDASGEGAPQICGSLRSLGCCCSPPPSAPALIAGVSSARNTARPHRAIPLAKH